MVSLTLKRRAAGLYKMKALADRGFVQGILPPQPRPNLRLLREVGFQGSDEQVTRQAAHAAPQLLSAFTLRLVRMWDRQRGDCLTVGGQRRMSKSISPLANLNNKLHRMQAGTHHLGDPWRHVRDPRYFAHHAALPQHGDLGDEGAANHNRFCREYDRQGVQFFRLWSTRQRRYRPGEVSGAADPRGQRSGGPPASAGSALHGVCPAGAAGYRSRRVS